MAAESIIKNFSLEDLEQAKQEWQLENTLKSKYSEEFGQWFRKELYYCYLEARKHKRSTYDEHNFEMFDIENLERLAQVILSETYHPGVGISFVTTKPVYREIFAARFSDRIVHHFIYDVVSPWWEPRFIQDSYSCQKGKGTLYGIERAEQMMRKVTNGGSRRAVVMKFDMTAFFMNIRKNILYERIMWGLDQQLGQGELHRLTSYLWRKTIFDEPAKRTRKRGDLSLWDKIPKHKSLYHQPPGQGLIIGNLSSQLSSNIHLDALDHYIRYTLGYKYYGRYVDDFFIMMPEEDASYFLEVDFPLIVEYLLGIGIKLHKDKIYIQPVEHGMEFLGAMIYPGNIQLGRRIKRQMWRIMCAYSHDDATLEQMTAVLGMAKNYKATKLLIKMFRQLGWDYFV